MSGIGSHPQERELLLKPIGIAHTSLASKVEAPRQPEGSAESRIELFSGRNFEHALEDLENWERIWVLFWFHLNEDWRPKVLPPRSTSGRKGVFATRSPHRPNPIGLSALRLIRIQGLDLYVEGADLVDGTPVLDIKPYVAYTDAFPDGGGGWLESASQTSRRPDPIAPWTVSFADEATEQAQWIEARTGMALRQRIAAVLELGPEPHAYRRIRAEGAGFRLGLKEWRVHFSTAGRQIRVQSIRSGFRPSQFAGASGAPDDVLTVHRDFSAAWHAPG